MFNLTIRIEYILILCLIIQTSSNSNWKSKLLDNTSYLSFDQINGTEFPEEIYNLTESLVKLREFFLSTEMPLDLGIPFEKVLIDAQKQVNQFKKHSGNVKNVFLQNADSQEQSQLKYSKAMVMLNCHSGGREKEAYRLLMEASAEGYSDAKGEIGWASLFGVHLPMNISGATSIFEELASEGHPEGHTGLAFLYAVGLGLTRSEERALLHFTIGALGGSKWARMALGYRHLYGISVAPDCEKALQYYRLVAETVVKESKAHDGIRISMASILDESERWNYEIIWKILDLKNYYALISEKGDVEAQFNLGHMYYHGVLGLQRDTKKALYYFKLAESNGIVEATAFIGKIYLEGGDNTEVNYEEAFHHFEKAAKKENPVGEAGLGIMYLEGIYVKKDYQKAYEYLNKSAQKGLIDGLIALAKMHFEGLGLPRNYDLARKYLITASQSGHITAIYLLGKMYDQGYGSYRSCLSATDLFKNVAEKGTWDKLFVDAYSKFKQRKYKESFIIYSLLSEIGYAAGQASAAMLLDEYSVALPFVEHSTQRRNDSRWTVHRKAFQYWYRAARQGEQRALTRIGDHYYYGLGVEVNYEAAFLYYRHAALFYSNAEAMYNLGYMHEHGVGLQKDANLARRCYDMAIEMNNESWLPVGLTLLKMNILQSVTSIRILEWSFLFLSKKMYLFALFYWDIVIIALLSVVCINLIYIKYKNRLMHAN